MHAKIQQKMDKKREDRDKAQAIKFSDELKKNQQDYEKGVKKVIPQKKMGEFNNNREKELNYQNHASNMKAAEEVFKNSKFKIEKQNGKKKKGGHGHDSKK